MKDIRVVWKKGPAAGRIEVMNGSLHSFGIETGDGIAQRESWRDHSAGPLTLVVSIEPLYAPGEGKLLVSIVDWACPFSFFAEDVHEAYPIYMPDYGVAVTSAADFRSYEELEADIKRRGLRTNLQKLAEEPEESFEAASAATKDQPCPIWQGVSRDTRIFESQVRGRPSNNFWEPPIGGSALQWDWVQPRQHATEVGLPESGGKPVRYYYMVGRGMGCTDGVVRKLEEGTLPILHTEITDDEMVYTAVSFVSYESRRRLRIRSYVYGSSGRGAGDSTSGSCDLGRDNGILLPDCGCQYRFGAEIRLVQEPDSQRRRHSLYV